MTIRSSRILAFLFWLIVFISLLVEDVFRFSWTTGGEYEAAAVLIYASSIFIWFLADARERGIDPSGGLKLAVVALAAIAVPYYKFRYFGTRDGFLFLFIVLANFAFVVIGAMAVDFMV